MNHFVRPGHCSPALRHIHGNLIDAVYSGQLLFYQPAAGRAGDPLYRELNLLVNSFINNEVFLQGRVVIHRQFSQRGLKFSITPGSRFGAKLIIIFQTIVDDGFGYRLTTGTAHNPVFTEYSGMIGAVCFCR